MDISEIPITCANLGRYDRVIDAVNRKYVDGLFAYDKRCSHENSKKIEEQQRSADELVTTRFFCLDCETFIQK